MVFLTLKLKRELAACCRVDVIKGAAGFERVGLSSRLLLQRFGLLKYLKRTEFLFHWSGGIPYLGGASLVSVRRQQQSGFRCWQKLPSTLQEQTHEFHARVQQLSEQQPIAHGQLTGHGQLCSTIKETA